MAEILSRRFDELSPVGGIPACTVCSIPAAFNDGESRTLYDDVDDSMD
jgi:MSHA pilin protein MshD